MIDRLIDFSAHHRFAVLALVATAALIGWHSMSRLPLDALPDTGDRQVIVYSQWDRSPDQVDALVTSPIVTAMLGAPRVKSVRGVSDFGASFVYVIFDDDADPDWARSRTLERLSTVTTRLPEGVRTEIGPDASALGWIFQYILVDELMTRSLSDLRAYHDWSLKPYLRAISGVAEVATIGGFARQYQVTVDPHRLLAYELSIQRVVDALKSGNRDAGGGVVESGGSELVVRGLGAAHSVADLKETLVASAQDGTPIYVKDVATVSIGAEARRGVSDIDGTGEVVSGIIVMRQGENALDVINRVKSRIRQIEPSLPSGLKIVPVYDRSELIRRSIDNLTKTILEVAATVAVVILLFLWHIPSAVVPLITLPLAVLIVFIPCRLLGIGANLMSLGGIAIAVGALVDAAIILVDQTHKKLEEWDRAGRQTAPDDVIVRAIKQVGRPAFFALLVIAVSFLPILALQGEAGRLFKPMAYTKSLAMLVAAFLAITLDPVLRLMFTRVEPWRFTPSWACRTANAVLVGTIRSEDKHPISRWLMQLYQPVVEWSLIHTRMVVGAAIVLVLGTIPVWRLLGTEFMPPTDEGALLYMPSTMPGISVGEAQRLLQTTDRILKQFPQVQHVLGKAGRADTATDPAPLSMLETLIVLQPERSWPRTSNWYSAWAPEWARSLIHPVLSGRMSIEKLVDRMNRALAIPGVGNAWSMPIRGRIEMLATGVRTPVGIKVSGSDLAEIERIGARVGTLLSSVPGTRGAFAEQAGEGRFLDVRWNRTALAAAGVAIDDAQAAIRFGVGGENVTTIGEGRERYPVTVRYPNDIRSDPYALGRVLVAGANGRRQVSLDEVAEIVTTRGPVMIRNEDGMPTGYVYLDVSGRDLGSYMTEADGVIRSQVKLPPGYSIAWTGEYEAITRTNHQLVEIVPLTLLIVVLLLYSATRSIVKTLIVLLACPFSAIGAVWALYLLGYHISVAVWIGLIALIGIDAETGVFMLLYLDDAYDRARQENRLNNLSDLDRAVLEGAARRVRPKFMTVATMCLGLLPILWSTGSGSEVMKRIAAPMVGGIMTSFILELLVYPPVYRLWRSRSVISR